MLIIYNSNCLELFMNLVINVISSQRLSNPLQSEIILIDNKIIGKWIEIKLTQNFGVAANFTCMSIASFMKKICTDIFNTNVNIQEFSQDVIFWRFMQILPKIGINSADVIIQKYLYNDFNQRKCEQLSDWLSNLFLEYLVYRPSWLDSWSFNKIIENIDFQNQIWQSEIWRMLIQHMNVSKEKCNLWNYCINLLQKNVQKNNYTKLPKRIFIFGITSIPPIYWKILNLLSKHINLYVWFITPCINSYKYIRYNKLHANKNIFNILENNCFVLNHPLLHAWGKTGQEALCILGQSENFFTINSFIVPKQNSMLNILQKDILESSLYTLNVQEKRSSSVITQNKTRYVVKSSDQSITIHICHSIQREIEILHENLLFMLSKNSELSPGEIIVMAPNINDYESSIKNVFNNTVNRKLPFTISNNLEKYTYPIISALLKILNISHSRCTSEEIFSLLSISPIASRFNINPKEAQLLQKWITEIGIRWGIDENTMYNFHLPITDKNTWYFGLRRMLLGYAMKSHNGLWKNIFPYDYTNEEYINLISRLGEFLDALKKWRDCLNVSYTLIQWMSYFQNLINDFINFKNLDLEENKALLFFKTCWIDIIQSGIKSGYTKAINIIVLKDILNRKLHQKKINCQFLPNSINFLNITPVCYIPCKILCIIGMHANMFPRNISACNYNLILKKSNVGDNNIWEKDCYTFLLACLLPTERMYISFVKKTEHYNNNIISYTSKLIDELLEYIAQKFYLAGDSNLEINNNTKNLCKYLFYRHSHMPFDAKNFITDIHHITKSFSKEWLSAAKTKINSNISIQSNFVTKLSNLTTTIISLHELYSFYSHPIRIWFQKRLGVFFPSNIQRLLNNEPFTVDNLHRFLLNMKVINYILHNKNTEELYYESCASGILPYGSFGKLFWMKEYEQMHKLTDQIKPYYFPDKIFNLNVSLEFNKVKLIGQVNMVQKNGLIRWKSSNLFMKDYFLLWIEHLIYCSIGGTGDSQLFGINTIWRFPNLPKSIANELLFSLISDYCIGINTPLMLLYRSGGAWINSIFNWTNKTIYSTYNKQKTARCKLIQAWQGTSNNKKNFFAIGENQDPYLRKIIPVHLSEEDISKIINIAKRYFLNVMQNRLL